MEATRQPDNTRVLSRLRETLRRSRGSAGRVAFALVTTVAAGDTLHLLVHELHLPVTHHFFHVFFSVAAAAVFAGYVIRDGHRHGWPRFSWCLQP